MNVGVAKLTLRLSASRSLKDKRRVIGSLCHRVQNRFNVSVAEVDSLDAWQRAVLGISCTSNSARHTEQMLDSVIEFIEKDRPDAELVDCEVETLTGF